MDTTPHFDESIDRFIKLQRRKRIISDKRDVSILDLVEQMEPLSIEEIKEGFDLLDQEAPEAKFFLKQVRESFIDTARALNRLNPSRRLYALETFNFLGTIERLEITTEALLFAEDHQLNPVALSFITTFRGTDQVVDTLCKHEELFDPATKSQQIRALSNFRTDMAEQLLTLLSQDFVLAESKNASLDSDQSLEIMRHLIRTQTTKLAKNLIQGQQLSINFAKVIAFIQGHKLMPIYAKKRSDFMKNFIDELSSTVKVDGVGPQDMSKVVACFFYSNEQRRPPEELIGAMLGEESFDSPDTKDTRMQFLSLLAPTTVDVILKDVRDFLHLLTSSPLHDIEETFEQAKQKYEAGLSNEDSLMGRFYDTAMDLKAAGHLAFDNITQFAKKLKSALTKPTSNETQRKSIDELLEEVPEATDIDEYRVILRDPGAKERAEEYMPVTTTEIGYRSAMSDGGKRGASINLQLFKSAENLQEFKDAFLILFKKLQQDNPAAVVANEFKHPQASHTVQEYYLPLLVPMDGDDPLLFCVGVGYFEKELKWQNANASDQNVADAYMDPYCFLMHIKNSDTTMNARSRKLNTDIANLKGKEFKSINLRGQAYSQACLAILLDLLHLIDESEWETKETQQLVAYLYKALNLTPEYY